MKPFDLEKALAGEPIRDVAGNKRYIFKHPEAGYLVSYGVDNINICCNTVWYKEISPSEFTMWQEPQPRVQLDLPAPLKHAEENQIVFKKGSRRIIAFQFLPNIAKHQDFLEAGSLFATKEDAQEWLEAMKGARK